MEMNLKALTQQQIEDIHEATLDLLWRYGIDIRSQEARDTFKAHGCIVEGDMVRIPPQLVEASIKTVPSEFTMVARNPARDVTIGEQHRTVLFPGLGPVYVQDLDNKRRFVQMEDFYNFLKLIQTSDFCDMTTAMVVYPEAEDKRKVLYEQMVAACTYSDKPILGLINDRKIAADCLEMSRLAVGRGDDVCYVIASANAHSAMAWDENMLDGIRLFAEKNQPVVLSCCAMTGFTSHITIEGTLITTNAEILAGVVYSQLCREGAPVVYGNTSTVTDMRFAALSIGAPEEGIFCVACAQLARFYGIPYRGGGCLSDAKELDAQAGAEAMMNLFLTIGTNVDVCFHSLGILDSFNAISYQKWIMDEEILGRIKAFRQPLTIDKDLVDTLGEVGSGDYIMHDDTLDNFKDSFYAPPLSSRIDYQLWLEEQADLKTRASRLVRERLESFRMPDMDEAVRSALNKYLEP